MKRWQVSKLRLQAGTHRLGWKWYRKWFDVILLPSVSVHFVRGNRAHLEPNSIGLTYGWLLWDGYVWFCWPYKSKQCDIAY